MNLQTTRASLLLFEQTLLRDSHTIGSTTDEIIPPVIAFQDFFQFLNFQAIPED